jgi:integrase
MANRRRSTGSVTQKRGLWYAIVSLDRDARGRQIRQWSRGFPTRRQAEHELAQLLIEQRREKRTNATVKDVIARYITEDVTSSGRRSPTTTQRYWGLLANIAELHDRKVDRLTGPDIESFYLRLLAQGLSHTTVHHVHNLMFAAFRWGNSRRVGLVTRNPYIHDAVGKPRRAKSGALSLTIDQAEIALLEIMKSKHSNALIFALATGCRRGEVCGLKWEAIDFERRVAIIRESRYQVKGTVAQKCVKEERIREIPLNETATLALRAEYARQGEWARVADDAWVDTDFVFTDQLGSALSPMKLTNAFGRVGRRAKLPTTRLHDLRHTNATFILSAGGNPVAASKILGHSEEGTTLRIYGHVIGLDERRAMRSVDKALSRHLRRHRAERMKKAPINGPDMVAPTGIEPVFPP